MKVRLTHDLIVDDRHLPIGEVADFGEESAKLLVRKGKAEYVTETDTDERKRDDSGSDSQRMHGKRKKSSKG